MAIKNLHLFIRTITLATLCICVSPSTFAGPESKRIEVYSLSQNYWDTRYGDTLGEIAHHLLPNNPAKRATLEQDILHLNPHAFINGDPEQLLAEKRLWLPGYMQHADSKVDSRTTTVEHFSWGNIKRQRD